MAKNKNKNTPPDQPTLGYYGGTTFDPNATYGYTGPDMSGGGGKKKKRKNAQPAGPAMNTDTGRHWANENQEGYLDHLMGKAGVDVGGVTPWHEWLRTKGYESMGRGYQQALGTNPDLDFTTYMQSMGVPADANQWNSGGMGAGSQVAAPSPAAQAAPAVNYQGGGPGGRRDKRRANRAAMAAPAAPVNTGNAYTSSSGGGGGYQGSGPGGRRDKRKAANAGAPAPPPGLPQYTAANLGFNPNPQGASMAATRPFSRTGGLNPMLNPLKRKYMQLTPEQSGEYMSGYAPGPGRWAAYG